MAISTEEKVTIKKKAESKRLLLRFAYGFKEVFYSIWKMALPVAYILFASSVWSERRFYTPPINSEVLLKVYNISFDIVIALLLIMGFFALMCAIGTPLGSKRIHEGFKRVGFVNSAGEAPVLLSKRKKDKNILFYQFTSSGIPLEVWEEKRTKLEAVMNIQIISMMYIKGTKQILVKAVSAKNTLPDAIYWIDECMRGISFELALGESFAGVEYINLNHTPHILIGGSTGSGKTILLKCLLMQCIKKQARVILADFKGGVDYSSVWHEKAEIVTDKDNLITILESLITELEDRKLKLKVEECPNIDEYNKKSDSNLQRIVFACDEVAELLDKTGLSKEDKERISQIEAMISTIARQGRAFGIHLILATQRPSADIISGQIKNNIDLRICGKADKVLSSIILDNSDGAERIPKDSHGLFVTNQGLLFKGYLFDESEV